MRSNTPDIYSQMKKAGTKLGDLRKIAKEIKKDHELAMELWSTGEFLPRQLAILIMDKKLLSQDLIDQLDQDLQHHEFDERNQLADWLMANQLIKDKKTIALIEWTSFQMYRSWRTNWFIQRGSGFQGLYTELVT